MIVLDILGHRISMMGDLFERGCTKTATSGSYSYFFDQKNNTAIRIEILLYVVIFIVYATLLV